MHVRDETLFHAIDVINAGSSLDIVGDYGSGRSHLLDQIGEYFTGRGTNVLRLEGWPAFQGTPLAALGWLSVSMTSLQSAYNDLVALIGDRASLILVDNWDSVDPMSWGVLARVRRTTRVPIVTTRLSGTSTRGAFIDTGFAHTFQLRLTPLRVKELERTLSDESGHEFDPGTMSELYAMTGGNLGLARALYESALRGGRLRLEDNTLSSDGDLWTPAMTTIVETILRPLSPELQTSLGTIAFLGPAPTASVITAIGRPAVEALADAGFIEVYSAGAVAVVAIRQPIISAYFRNQTSNIRRLLIADDIHDVRTAAMLSAISGKDDSPGQFVVLLHEYENRRLSQAREAWAREQTRDTAAALLAVLGRTGNTGSEIPPLIRKSRDLPGSPDGIIAWEIWYASYRALVQGDPSGAAAMLQERAGQHPDGAGLLLMRRALVETMLVEPVDPAALPQADELPDDEKWQLPTHQAYIAVVTGRVKDAVTLADELKKAGVTNSLVDLVAVVAYTADGRYADARAIASAGIRKASEAFEPGEMFRYAYMGGLSSFIAGRHGEAEDMIGAVAQLVAPVDEGLTHLGIQAIATSIESRRGGAVPPLADSTVNVHGAFPGMQRAWVTAELQRASGDARGASDQLMAVGDDLWQRGFRLAAVYAYLSAVGADLTAGRLDRVSARVGQVDGAGIAAHAGLLRARVSRDVVAMRDAAQQAENDGRWFFALLTWGEVAELAERNGDEALAQEAEAHATRLRTEVEGTGVPTSMRRLPHNLTDREREIARLAASGLPNAEIGQMLFVSPRTVESHLNRAMRKAGVQSRQELRDLYRSGD